MDRGLSSSTIFQHIVQSASNGCSLIIVRTPDQPGLLMRMGKGYESYSAALPQTKPTTRLNLLQWQAAIGLRAFLPADLAPARLQMGQPALAPAGPGAAPQAPFAGEHQLGPLLRAIATLGVALGADPTYTRRDRNGPDEMVVTAVFDVHRILQPAGGAGLVSLLREIFILGRSAPIGVILVCSDHWAVPDDLKSMAVIIDDPLPSAQELAEGPCCLLDDKDEPIWDAEESQALGRTLVGLPTTVVDQMLPVLKYENEGVPFQELLRTVWRSKADRLNSDKVLEIIAPERCPQLSDIIGLQGLKDFCLAAYHREPDAQVAAQGIILYGPAGTAKSTFAKALAREVGLPVSHLRVGNILGSYQGETERNWYRTETLLERQGRQILLLDEFEGVMPRDDGRSTDSSRRLLSLMQTWLAEPHEAIIVASCNDISYLPPALTRAGRFDAIFYNDLPNPLMRQALWRHYRKFWKLREDQWDIDPARIDWDHGWTGGEIRQCCRHARLLDKTITEVKGLTCPVSVRYREVLEANRDWANGRVTCAETGQPYVAPAGPDKDKGGRRRANPTLN